MRGRKKWIAPVLGVAILGVGLFSGSLAEKLLPDGTNQIYTGEKQQGAANVFYPGEGEEALSYPWDSFNRNSCITLEEAEREALPPDGAWAEQLAAAQAMGKYISAYWDFDVGAWETVCLLDRSSGINYIQEIRDAGQLANLSMVFDAEKVLGYHAKRIGEDEINPTPLPAAPSQVEGAVTPVPNFSQVGEVSEEVTGFDTEEALQSFRSDAVAWMDQYGVFSIEEFLSAVEEQYSEGYETYEGFLPNPILFSLYETGSICKNREQEPFLENWEQELTDIIGMIRDYSFTTLYRDGEMLASFSRSGSTSFVTFFYDETIGISGFTYHP